MPESWATRRTRWALNCIPAYRGTGARVEYIADDWLEVRVRLSLSWRTRNYVGTIFGGSLYGALDPVYMIMLIKVLGPEFIVWDKMATIRFLKPGRTTLRATFRLEPSSIASIRAEAIRQGKVDRDFEVSLLDDAGTPHVTCTKTVYIRWRAAPNAPMPPT